MVGLLIEPLSSYYVYIHKESNVFRFYMVNNYIIPGTRLSLVYHFFVNLQNPIKAILVLSTVFDTALMVKFTALAQRMELLDYG